MMTGPPCTPVRDRRINRDTAIDCRVVRLRRIPTPATTCTVYTSRGASERLYQLSRRKGIAPPQQRPHHQRVQRSGIPRPLAHV